MRFWSVAVSGFVVLMALLCLSLSLPVAMMGMANADLWMREPVMFSLIVINSLAFSAYLAAVTWAN